ncbi:hypothetical protein K470DRAFT_258736 [Piedraia hortae CBS 480.64]|uniref:Uncharacterized protein n=1 Tax=Piedraia hortae CBS 480.64 TaxID=1314780 RepID=A0A6A7BXW8_9PEZI|nr:hypothetical protein K470DRAFT_258736 [Piedraia hortae CBS 480.64]
MTLRGFEDTLFLDGGSILVPNQGMRDELNILTALSATIPTLSDVVAKFPKFLYLFSQEESSQYMEAIKRSTRKTAESLARYGCSLFVFWYEDRLDGRKECLLISETRAGYIFDNFRLLDQAKEEWAQLALDFDMNSDGSPGNGS